MAGRGGQIGFRLVQPRQVPMQPRGVNGPILGRETGGHQQQQKEETFGHFRDEGLRVTAGIPQNLLDANRNLSFY